MPRPTGVWLAYLLAGCAVVLPAEQEEVVGAIDGDDDGTPRNLDCDDADPLRSPGRPEIVADGIDNDCDGSDLLDGDGDGFPATSREVYTAEQIEAGRADDPSQVAWPGNVQDGPVDCDDEDGDIYPGRFDAPYDGIDADCDAGNDFDADRDGQMPVGTDPDAVLAYAASLGITIDVASPDAFADCNDEDPSVFAGAPSDVPYDGHDGNCDGSNDFDLDGDGFIPVSFVDAYAVFVERYHPDPANAPDWVGSSLPGDCLDQAHPDVPLAPERVYPHASDAPYDGVDADCAGDSDFDADGDGFTSDAHDAAIETYRQLWAAGDPPSFVPTLSVALPEVEPGDCDDGNDAVAPGRLEQLGDSLDVDCDGGVDTTPLGFGALSFAGPRQPRVVATEDHYLIAATAEQMVRHLPTGGQPFLEPGVGITFAREPVLPGYQADPFDVYLWANVNPLVPLALSPAYDVVTGSTLVYQVVSNAAPPDEELRWLQQQHQQLFGTYGSPQQVVASSPWEGDASDVDAGLVLDADDGLGLAVACGGAGRDGGGPLGDADGTVRFLVTQVPFSSAVPPLLAPDTGGAFATPGSTADVCWMRTWREDPVTVRGLAHVCDLDGCLAYETVIDTSSTPSATAEALGSSPYSGRGIVAADVHGSLLVTVEDAGVVLEHEDGSSQVHFAGEPVLAADAVVQDGQVYAVAVIAALPTNVVELAYGPVEDPGEAVRVRLAVEDDDPRYEGGIGCDPASGSGCSLGRLLEPTRVAIHADAERVVVAVAASVPDGYTERAPLVGGTPAPQGAIGWSFFVPAP